MLDLTGSPAQAGALAVVQALPNVMFGLVAGALVIEQGEVEVRTDGGDAQILGPGNTFGEIGLLLTGHRTATVVARTPMRLVSLSGHDFERIRARVPELERILRRLGVERASR
jgi:CRP-like cAMP-binding protein